MSFTNKVVLITGAASGIGEAIALNFAKESAKLSLFDINSDNLNNVAKKCEELGKTKALTLVVDVTKDEDLKKGVDFVIKNYGRIDILINCAGTSVVGGILHSNVLETFDKVINLNLRAVVAAMHYTAAELIKTEGCIVNIASIIGSVATANRIAYNSSKAAVIHLTKCVALELADQGVRVNCISPGAAKTNLYANLGSTSEERNKIINNFRNSSALKRLIKVEDIAELVAYLASDKAKNITGANYNIDSGFSLLKSNT